MVVFSFLHDRIKLSKYSRKKVVHDDVVVSSEGQWYVRTRDDNFSKKQQHEIVFVPGVAGVAGLVIIVTGGCSNSSGGADDNPRTC
jgi:hypothetical protein